MTEGEMVGWHHRFDGHEFEQALGVGDGQGGLTCCSPWDHKQSDTTEWLHFMFGCESWTIKKAEHQRIDTLNCGVGEDSCQSLGLQGDPVSPS